MKKLAACLVLTLLAAQAFAGAGAFKLSLWDRAAVAIPNNIDEVKGFELGIGSAADSFKGVQFDVIFAQTHEEMAGLSHALVNFASDMSGVQGGLVTKADRVRGVQWGAINLIDGQVSGVQWGLYNQSACVTGLQLGVINYAKNLHGLQLGLINIAKNGWLPAMLIVNGRF